jgi:hypothetical protein
MGIQHMVYGAMYTRTCAMTTALFMHTAEDEGAVYKKYGYNPKTDN